MARAKAKPRVEAPTWETSVLESVGRVMEFWGFKRNHGRVWALLYLQDAPLSASAIGERLNLSKGAVSIIASELQSWAVIRRVPVATRSGVAFVAEDDMWRMLENVLRQRELRLVEQVQGDLAAAKRQVERDPVLDRRQRRQLSRRISNLLGLARAGQVAIQMLLRSRRTNLTSLRSILSAGGR